MDNKKDIVWRVYIVYIGMFVLTISIIARVLYISVVQGEVWREKAKKLSLMFIDIEANRGNIYDANGEFLATSVPLFEIRMDVSSPYITDEIFNGKADSLAQSLANYFKDRTRREYRSILQKGRNDKNRYLLLKRNVNYDDLKTLRKFPIFKIGKNKGGLIAEAQNKRVLPYRELAFRTIGWYKEGEGAKNIGLEGAYSGLLEGISGKRLMQRIPGGNWRPLNTENEVDPNNGADIISTIDIHLQDVAEDALLRQLIAVEADHGCAILMEVKTGQIKAIANLGKTRTGGYSEKYNYAIGESTEPGSTFKLFSLLAAFEDGKAKLTDIVNCGGGQAKYANRIMRDSHLGLGDITVQQAFEKSSNVGISKIIYRAYAANPQAFIDRLWSFKANKQLGLDVPGEGYPSIKGTKSKIWSKVSLPWMAIGYEVALTPMQILTFYNSVANDGVMVKPQFVKEIHQGGMVVKSFSPQIINKRVASPEAIKMARTMMEGVVIRGTGTALKSAVYKVAGKTGTAQVAMNNAGYNKSNYKGSFVGYFPAENPKYSCIVVINNPNTSKGYYGGAISAPVFRQIADRVYANDPQMGHDWADTLNKTFLPGSLAGYARDINRLAALVGYRIPASSTGWFGLVPDSSYKVARSLQYNVSAMPDVSGMSVKDAVYLLEKIGLKVRINGMGLVKRQSLQAGSHVVAGNTVILDLEV
jgi:cell division protein FtsI (penicillin-binding protein 3)